MSSSLTRISALDLAINPTVREINRLSYLDLEEVPAIEVPPAVVAAHAHAVNGPLQSVKDAYARLEMAYHKKFPLTFRARVLQVQAGLSKGCSLLSSAYKAVDPIIDIFRNTVLTGENALLKNKGFLRFVKGTRLFSFFSLPISLVNMAKGGYELALSAKKKNYAEIAEQALNVTSSLGDLSFGISTCIDGLIASKIIESTAALTTASTYLTGIGAILSVAAIGLQSKFIYESVKFKNRISKVFGSEEKTDFKAVLKEVDKLSNSRLGRTVGVSDGEKLKARLHSIFERNSKPVENANHKKNLIDTVKALKKRVKWNNIGRALKITAAVISLIALAVLLFTPAAPVGYALMALATAIGLSILLMDYKAERTLNDYLKTLAPDGSPEMWKFYERKRAAKELQHNPMVRLWDLSRLGNDVRREPPKREEVPLPKINVRRRSRSVEGRERDRLENERRAELLRQAQADREERFRVANSSD